MPAAYLGVTEGVVIGDRAAGAEAAFIDALKAAIAEIEKREKSGGQS